MSYEESIRSITLKADDTIGVYTGPPGYPGSASPHGGKQYHFVVITDAATAGLAASGDKAHGVLQNKPQNEGAAATVAIRGVSNVVAGAAIAAGAEVQANGSAQAVTKSTGWAVGVALQAAGGAGELIPVLLY
jgi:hypothetical protein